MLTTAHLKPNRGVFTEVMVFGRAKRFAMRFVSPTEFTTRLRGLPQQFIKVGIERAAGREPLVGVKAVEIEIATKSRKPRKRQREASTHALNEKNERDEQVRGIGPHRRGRR